MKSGDAPDNNNNRDTLTFGLYTLRNVQSADDTHSDEDANHAAYTKIIRCH